MKQAGREWNKEISKFLISIGLKQNNTDKCIFTKYKNNKLLLILSLYVDDILLTGTDEEIKYVSNKLQNKYQISKYTNANKIIGINILKTDQGYKINQIDYIEKLIKKYNMKKTKPIKYPSRKIPKDEREKSPEINKTIYKSIIGELLFIDTKTRPDIAFAVNQAARHSENLREVDLKSAYMILQYLNSTKEKSIHYIRDKNISVYSDADFAEDEETRKSTTGYIFLNGNSPISWKSQLQKCVTLSTAEAEFVSITKCTKHGIWLQK